MYPDKRAQPKGSIGHAFTLCVCAEKSTSSELFPFDLSEMSVLTELASHLFPLPPPKPLRQPPLPASRSPT
eukprot:920739-Prorocentrum_lima.AAC.1